MSSENPPRLSDILAGDDPLGLLVGKKSGSARTSEDEIAIGRFEAVNAFFDANAVLPGNTDNGREPQLTEFELEGFLEAFRGSAEFRELLRPYDRHALLGVAPPIAETPTTMAEIIAADSPLLSGEAETIFDLKYVPDTSSKSTPDDVAQRRRCANFEDYVPLFAKIAADLKAGHRYSQRFQSEGTIQPGSVFILNGITAYVDSVGVPQRRGKETDAQLRVVFENGTESNHLLRSFARVLYRDENGRQVLEASPTISGPLFTGQAEPAPEEVVTGFVYVVESLSNEPAIAALRGQLYKLGFTTQAVEDRIANAAADPTFLSAPVRIVTTFQAVNVRASRLEALIHLFFDRARLDVTLHMGRPVNPKEWFVVPLDLVREAITRILDGSILNYRYDAISRKIVGR
jgi:hypothetical protein